MVGTRRAETQIRDQRVLRCRTKRLEALAVDDRRTLQVSYMSKVWSDTAEKLVRTLTDSSYSDLAIHICWKVDKEARMEPPIQTEYLRSGGATICTSALITVHHETLCPLAITRENRYDIASASRNNIHLDLHGGRSKSRDLLLHTVGKTAVHGGTTLFISIRPSHLGFSTEQMH